MGLVAFNATHLRMFAQEYIFAVFSVVELEQIQRPPGRSGMTFHAGIQIKLTAMRVFVTTGAIGF